MPSKSSIERQTREALKIESIIEKNPRALLQMLDAIDSKDVSAFNKITGKNLSSIESAKGVMNLFSAYLQNRANSPSYSAKSEKIMLKFTPSFEKRNETYVAGGANNYKRFQDFTYSINSHSDDIQIDDLTKIGRDYSLKGYRSYRVMIKYRVSNETRFYSTKKFINVNLISTRIEQAISDLTKVTNHFLSISPDVKDELDDYELGVEIEDIIIRVD